MRRSVNIRFRLGYSVRSGGWKWGVRDATFGRVVPSPWAIDVGGQPHLKESKAEAVQEVLALQSKGVRNIDVGCFQINLQNHPNAFADLEQAFDPMTNAQYAARFLSSLHDRLGGWQDAVAAYHSVTPLAGPGQSDGVVTSAAEGRTASACRKAGYQRQGILGRWY